MYGYDRFVLNMKKLLYFLLIPFTILADDYPVHQVLELKINSSINPATKSYIEQSFKKAHTEGFDLILIKLNTPGGLVSTTQEILTEFGDSDIPVAVWVTPEGASATSAGAILSSGAHLLFMSQATSIGAATPIQMSGDINQKDVKAKAINALVGIVQSMAESRGRNVKAFGEMVEKAKTFKSKEALEQKLIDGIVNNLGDFIDQLEGKKLTLKGKQITLYPKNPRFVEYKMDFGQQLLDIFANPGLAYILFLIGAALIYLELQAPGGFIAGSIGVVALIMSGIGFQVLPLNFGAMGLIILAFILFIMEIYITSYGILTLLGLGALISGSMFLFRTDNAYMNVSYGLIFGSIAAIVFFIGAMALFLYWDHKRSEGKLKEDFYDLAGKNGQIINIIESEEASWHYYQVKVHGELWKARSQKIYQPGDNITVVSEDKDNMILTI
jgi:membrane-bound serine protease (ClpP class)